MCNRHAHLCSTNITSTLSSPLFVCLDNLTKTRLPYRKELSPLSLPRNIAYTLTFSAQGEYILCFPKKNVFLLHFPLTFFSDWNCRVIFGMLIALPITLVYYILLGLWRGRLPESWFEQDSFGAAKESWIMKNQGRREKV